MEKEKFRIYEYKTVSGHIFYQIEVKIIGETENEYLVKYLKTLYNEGVFNLAISPSDRTKTFFGGVPKRFKPALLNKKLVKLLKHEVTYTKP